jgi:CubicO group peptidase (beta-lactamase class C family)
VWIGLPEAEEARVARFIPHRPDPAAPSAFTRAIRADRASLPALALLNQGRFNPGSRAGRAAEVGAAGGLATARGLADLYRPLATGGAPLVDPDTLARMGEVATASPRDATLLLGTRFSLGFMKSIDNRRSDGDRDSVLVSSAAFGHVGAGGSVGFADPGCRMSFGYVMNRLGPGVLLNERGQSLVDAAYRALGYRSDASGVWAR